MKKKYTLVSTYPEKGSKNIGDALITSATLEAIRCVKDDVDVNVVFRGEKWDKVKDGVLESDAIVFACLAIRKDMSVVYPFLQNVLKSNIPVGVIAAGTSLNMSADRIYVSALLDESLKMLRSLNDQVLFWTNRGALTQGFCEYHGLNKACFSGDIAFYDHRYVNLSFGGKYDVKKIKIAISDPHYANKFKHSFRYLVESIRREFPGAQVDVLMHGINPVIENLCAEIRVRVRRIYLDPDGGLDAYLDYDMHIGYRVHAHVSSLLRRKVSYLLEQDGRGADYGCSLNARCSTPSWERGASSRYDILIDKIKRTILPGCRNMQVPKNAVDVLLGMIKGDMQNDFEKFTCMDAQISLFNEMCLSALKRLP